MVEEISETIDMEDHQHLLSPLDHLTRRYLVMLLYFPLSNPNMTRIASYFKSGLQRMFETLPIMSGTVQSAPQSEQKGSLCVGAPWNAIDDVFRVNDLTSSDLDYENLRKDYFPATTSTRRELLSILLSRPKPFGPKNPVMMAQVNFVRNGMILVPFLHHSFVDGPGGTTVMDLWATFCRGDNGAEVISDGMLDRGMLMFGDEAGRLEDLREFISRPRDGSSAPQLPKVIENEVFFVSRSKLATLKSVVSASIASAVSGPSNGEIPTYISTNDALSALLFACITEARRSIQSTDTQQKIPFALAVSGRRLLKPPIPDKYVGNVTFYCHLDLPLDTVTTESHSIATIAHQIRKRLVQLDDTYVRRLIGALRHMDDIGELVPVCRASREWPFLITSWSTQGYYGMDWGSEIGARCERVRVPKVPWPEFDGLIVIMPELKIENGIAEEEAGLEVMVGLEMGAMQLLKGMEEWTRWAEWRCS